MDHTFCNKTTMEHAMAVRIRKPQDPLAGTEPNPVLYLWLWKQNSDMLTACALEALDLHVLFPCCMRVDVHHIDLHRPGPVRACKEGPSAHTAHSLGRMVLHKTRSALWHSSGGLHFPIPACARIQAQHHSRGSEPP